MSFPVVSHLVNKNSNKGVDQIINYMNTNPLFMHKPIIHKETIHEPSIRAYYNIKTVDNGVDPTAYAEFTRDKYHSQDLIFKNYNKKTLIDDLQTGTGNYANNFVEFKRAYLNNDGKPLIRNNTMLAGLYMNENNTPTDVPYTPSVPVPDPGPGGGGLPDPGPGPDPASIPLPPPNDSEIKGNKAAKNIQRREAKIQTRQAKKELQAKNLEFEFVNKAAETIQTRFKGYAAKKQLKDLKKADVTKYMGNVVDSIVENASKGKVIKLEGITPVKASSSKNEAEPVISEVVEATSSKTVKPSTTKDDTSGDSDETNVPNPDRMKEHKELLENIYKIPKSVTDTAGYSGSLEKIGLLNAIAKEFYQKAFVEEKKVEYANEFITMITTGEKTASGKSIIENSYRFRNSFGSSQSDEKEIKNNYLNS